MRSCHRTKRIRSLLAKKHSVGAVFNATGYDLVLIAEVKAEVEHKARLRQNRETHYLIRRQKAAGFTIPALMRDYNLSEEEVRVALGQTPDHIAQVRRRRKAVEDLRSQGFSEEQIAAVFGK